MDKRWSFFIDSLRNLPKNLDWRSGIWVWGLGVKDFCLSLLGLVERLGVNFSRTTDFLTLFWASNWVLWDLIPRKISCLIWYSLSTSLRLLKDVFAPLRTGFWISYYLLSTGTKFMVVCVTYSNLFFTTWESISELCDTIFISCPLDLPEIIGFWKRADSVREPVFLWLSDTVSDIFSFDGILMFQWWSGGGEAPRSSFEDCVSISIFSMGEDLEMLSGVPVFDRLSNYYADSLNFFSWIYFGPLISSISF